MSIFVGSAAKKYAVCWLWICTFLMLFSNNSLFWFSQQQWKINEWVRQGWKENWKMWVLGFFCELISKLNNGKKKKFFVFYSELISTAKKSLSQITCLFFLFLFFHFWWFILENANFMSKQTFPRISKYVLKSLENVNVAFIFWIREIWLYLNKRREKEQQWIFFLNCSSCEQKQTYEI